MAASDASRMVMAVFGEEVVKLTFSITGTALCSDTSF